MTVIDEYLNTLTEAQRSALQHIRDIAMQVVPQAVDTIGYGMPVLKYKNKYLIGFSAFKNHMSIFPGSEAIVVYKESLRDFKLARGTIQFTVEHQIPDALIDLIVAHRKNDIDGNK
jgi:uncharacterized protein YdhG (YjbR/CyaY superfamily)